MSPRVTARPLLSGLASVAVAVTAPTAAPVSSAAGQGAAATRKVTRPGPPPPRLVSGGQWSAAAGGGAGIECTRSHGPKLVAAMVY